MCGLTGIFDSTGERPIDAGLLRRMNDSMTHRGPDGDGHFIAPGIGLAHRRLSIIDLEGGVQPMFDDSGNIAVVFNGEIYNFQALRTELQERGHRFQTNSDTETIIHGWKEWGEDLPQHLEGMFVFALWDARSRHLFIARDRLGKKPLYYAALPDGQVLFGSELKALTVHPDLPREIDSRAIEEFFALAYVPEPRSIYRAVRKLPAAHFLSWRRGSEAKIAPYWDIAFLPEQSYEPGTAARELHTRFHEAVRARLISDVPLGAFLSGGVDSSGVVAQMAGLMDTPVDTFCMGFGEAAFDESDYAQIMAERYGTNHRMERVDPDAFDLVDRLAGIYDEPFGDSSAIPTFQVCALARKHVTVALSGDGGDEAFAGYRRYLWHLREARLRAMMPGALRKPLFGFLGAVYPKLDWAPQFLRAKTTFKELALDDLDGFFLSVSATDDGLRRSLFSESLKSELQGYHASEVLRHHWEAAATDDPLKKAQYTDIKTWLPGDILVKVDRASMANSLEVRAPLLDPELVSWGVNLPASLKIDGGEKKAVLKKALEPDVPDDLLYRPKQGFSVPIGEWFRGPLRERVRADLTGGALADSGFFDMATVTSLVDQHQSGRRDHSRVLWLALMFQAFLVRSGGLGSN